MKNKPSDRMLYNEIHELQLQGITYTAIFSMLCDKYDTNEDYLKSVVRSFYGTMRSI